MVTHSSCLKISLINIPNNNREIITGEIPYYNMNVNEIILKVGWEGRQVEIPTRGNPLILQIMKMCLSHEREKRPTFKEIVDKLQPKLKDTQKAKVNSVHLVHFIESANPLANLEAFQEMIAYKISPVL